MKQIKIIKTQKVSTLEGVVNNELQTMQYDPNIEILDIKLNNESILIIYDRKVEKSNDNS